MASFTVVRKIGAAGGLPYSTLSGWEADAPADYTTAEKSAAGTFATSTFIQNESLTFVGSGATGKFLDTDSTAPGNGTYIAYAISSGNPATSDVVTGATSLATCILSSGTPTNVGCIWQGQINAASDNFTGSTTRITFAGGTTSTTAYAELTTATGASFRDNASVQSNALRYNTANGCYITNSGNGYQPVVYNNQFNTRISKLQIFQSGTGPAIADDHAIKVEGCILEGMVSGVYLGTVGGDIRNSVVCGRGSGVNGICNVGSGIHTYTFYNATFVVPSDLTAATYCFEGANGYTTINTTNCALFGISNFAQGGPSLTHSGDYSNLTGTGVTQVTYAASLFGNGTTSITDATRDFRTHSGGAINAVVTADTTNSPNDIVGTVRPAGANASDAGSWQIPVAGSTVKSYGYVFG